MISITKHIALGDDEVVFTAIRAQGNGGQHVNKSATAVHLRFDIRRSSLPEYYKTCLLTARHHLITEEGAVVIKSQSWRSQEMNKEAAIARLIALIRELTVVVKRRKATQPGKASKARRLDDKTRRGATKSLRGKIRTLPG